MVQRMTAAICVAWMLAGTATSVAQVSEPIVGDPVELERMLGQDPLSIVSAEISRPKAQGDITLKAQVAFGHRDPIRVKLRKAMPGAEAFNNTPRYDIAAYELQKLLVDPADYVVPPTALRMIPAVDLQKFAEVKPTFPGSEEVLAVIQYWLHDVIAPADVLDTARFEADAAYATHIGQLNVLTYLIGHRDSNVGNFLISKATEGARVFSIDNGVAFSAAETDRGELWREMRVARLPAATVARLRQITQDQLKQRLAVLAQWQLRDGHYVSLPSGANLGAFRGVRIDGSIVQMGLTSVEISGVWRRCRKLVELLDDGKITTF